MERIPALVAVAVIVIAAGWAAWKGRADGMMAPPAVLLVSVAILSRHAAFNVAVIIGAALAGVSALVLARFAPPPEESRGSTWVERLTTGTVLLVFSKIGFSTSYHDEVSTFGHVSMAAQIARGAFPPFIPAFPEVGARYHSGFDLLAGLVVRSTGVAPSVAIDVLSITLLWVSSRMVGVLLPNRGAFVRAIPFLTGGLAWMSEGGTPLCVAQIPAAGCSRLLVSSPPISTWFQHPVSLGFPLSLWALHLSSRVLSGVDQRAALMSLVAWPALAISQVAHFALTASTVAVTGILLVVSRRTWTSLRATSTAWMVLVIGLCVSVLEGGFFDHDPLFATHLVVLRVPPGYPVGFSPGGAFAALGISVGVGVLLLPWMAWRALRSVDEVAISLVVLASAALIVPQLLDYVRSSDINKFPAAAALVLPLAYARTLDGGFGRPLRIGVRLGFLTQGLISTALVFAPENSPHRWVQSVSLPDDELGAAAAHWLVENGVDPRELVSAPDREARAMAYATGQAVLTDDRGQWFALGVDLSRISERVQHVAAIRDGIDYEASRRAGVAWIVAPSDDAIAARAAQEPHFLRVATLSSGLRTAAVYRVVAGARR